MYVKKIKNRSGSTSVIVASKLKGRYQKLHTIGVAKDEPEIEILCQKGLEWIRRRELEKHPELDLYGEERKARESEREMTERVVTNIDNILLNPNQSLGPIRLCNIKILGCSPKPKECLFLLHSPHKT